MWVCGPSTGWLATAEATDAEPVELTGVGLPKRLRGVCRSPAKTVTAEATQTAVETAAPHASD